MGLAHPDLRSWPKNANDLKDVTKLNGNIKKLETEFKNANKWKKEFNRLSNPSPNDRQPQSHRLRAREKALRKTRNYFESGKNMCENARKTLKLIRSLGGPWTQEQQIAFTILESTYNMYCNNPGGPGQGRRLDENAQKIDIADASKKFCMAATAGVVVYVVGKKVVGFILIAVPEPATSVAGAALVLSP